MGHVDAAEEEEDPVFLAPGSKDAGQGLYVYLGFALGWTDSV